jgi:hypothetical protein
MREEPTLQDVIPGRSIDAAALQRLDNLLNREDDAMGLTKGSLMRALLFAGNSSLNGV